MLSPEEKSVYTSRDVDLAPTQGLESLRQKSEVSADCNRGISSLEHVGFESGSFQVYWLQIRTLN